jgi:hypothetical protein
MIYSVTKFYMLNSNGAFVITIKSNFKCGLCLVATMFYIRQIKDYLNKSFELLEDLFVYEISGFHIVCL